MDASLWIAKTGLTAQQTRMQVISNNLANVNTTGFKKDRAVFEDLLYQNIVPAGGQADAQTETPTGLMLGTGTRVMATEKMHAQGNIITTENALDVAVTGDGFLSVQHHLPNQYQEHHCQLIEHLASFIAVSLENQKQRQRLESANQTLEILSTTDPLTGLANRYQLDNITPVLIHNAYYQKQSLAVLMIDVDEYKAYNDFHGHLEGDEALRIISRLLKKTFTTKNDYLFRYGGDEFMAICFGQSSSDIENKVVTLRKMLNEVKLANPKALYAEQLTLSIGGVNVDLASDNVDRNFKMICDIADKQLYQIKENGRNNYNLVDCRLLKVELV